MESAGHEEQGFLGLRSLTGHWHSGCEGFAGEGPAERFREHTVEVVNEGQQFLAQVVGRGEVAAADHLARDHAEDDFDLVEPGAVFRRLHEADAVCRIAQKRHAARDRFEHAVFAFFFPAAR